ncbi:type I restriction enzyme M protein [Methanococcus maripaludis]|uniref:site-specific DNA-methyltransferase (adenine-specific) n=1 Tax=Methanococcus maripaludis TaxID=39152 RepID=A0A7J9P7B9_METMI|nr:class I SAM-dependent DNA methyltransferase [Methanococcus maripaludis]MBA2858700.1 type I restriction enzyme M protein [Methanococcus maripaludis]
MSISSTIKSIQDIMRQDAGVDGDAQRISQLVWMLFLKIYDSKEDEWEIIDSNARKEFKSFIPEELRWRNWASDDEGLTGEELLDFVNNRIFKDLKDIAVTEKTDPRGNAVKLVFEDSFNYMKSGTLMRQVINKINEIDFESLEERHAFNDIYESILKDLQSAGNAGEFYTPRAVTQFVVDIVNPRLGESVADFACGTGGFLVSAINNLNSQLVGDKNTIECRKKIQDSIHGIEKKQLPHLLCVTNLILHDIDIPDIKHDNALTKNVRDYTENEKYNCAVMNPPFGGIEEDSVLTYFPTNFKTKETADLFLVLIMYRLKNQGRAGVVLPDGFLFGEGVKTNIKEKLLSEFNLHTIVRLPNGVFSPYTPVKTNLLFFDKTGPTKKIDYYQVPLPENLKNGFTKSKPFKSEHLTQVRNWWYSRENGDENAYSIDISEIKKVNYNLDFKNPNCNNNEKEYSLNELLTIMDKTSKNIVEILGKLSKALEGVEE